ncbi:hypothetical protein [Enterococcus sp.]|uniref:hypothetical protein n=1 Tax=Enterococcus sp. TaxID=35783 RepID=UPI002909CAF7|nr:hypothetical protein [Enterococcus sp.]MDU5334906.1 hypothetical protein [Enterococcus sp.]
MREVLQVVGFVLGIAAIILMVKISNDSAKGEKMTYDLIVTIPKSKAERFAGNATIASYAAWVDYGDGHFRGFATVDKQEMKAVVMETLDLTDSEVTIINAADNFTKFRA